VRTLFSTSSSCSTSCDWRTRAGGEAGQLLADHARLPRLLDLVAQGAQAGPIDLARRGEEVDALERRGQGLRDLDAELRDQLVPALVILRLRRFDGLGRGAPARLRNGAFWRWTWTMDCRRHRHRRAPPGQHGVRRRDGCGAAARGSVSPAALQGPQCRWQVSRPPEVRARQEARTHEVASCDNLFTDRAAGHGAVRSPLPPASRRRLGVEPELGEHRSVSSPSSGGARR
jgi:hypothetical protein